MTWAIFVAFIAKTIKTAAVFIFGSTGEIVTEKSGHLNMGIPGIMFLGERSYPLTAGESRRKPNLWD